MIERRIKELAIACEAMSRVGDLFNEMSDVKRLLQGLIREAETELYQPQKPPSNTTTDDDVPF